MTFLDIWEQPVITEFIRRRHEDIRKAAGGEEEFGKNIADTILQTVPHNGRYAKIRVQDVVPTGMAPFKAPGASPMLWTRKPQLREEVIELVDIDEFHRVDPIDMLQLQSPDPRAQAETAWTIADRGADMQDRNVVWTNSLFLYPDRVVVKTFDHAAGAWMPKLEREIANRRA